MEHLLIFVNGTQDQIRAGLTTATLRVTPNSRSYLPAHTTEDRRFNLDGASTFMNPWDMKVSPPRIPSRSRLPLRTSHCSKSQPSPSCLISRKASDALAAFPRRNTFTDGSRLVLNADREIFEMNNGCICCTVRGDLIRILGNLMKRKASAENTRSDRET